MSRPHAVIQHGLGTDRPHVEFWVAPDRKPLNLSYVVVDDNTILVIPPADTRVTVRVTNEAGAWYRDLIGPFSLTAEESQEEAEANVRKGTLLMRARAWFRR